VQQNRACSPLPCQILPKCKIYILEVLLEGPKIFEHHLSLKLQASPCWLCWLLWKLNSTVTKTWHGSSEGFSACIYHVLKESITLAKSRPCFATTDSIHTIMSVNFTLFLYILHDSLHIKTVVWMSHRMSWMDMICVCYGLHSHFIANSGF